MKKKEWEYLVLSVSKMPMIIRIRPRPRFQNRWEERSYTKIIICFPGESCCTESS